MKERICKDIIMKRKGGEIKKELIKFIGSNYTISDGQGGIIYIYRSKGFFSPLEIKAATIFFGFKTANEIIVYYDELYDSLKKFGKKHKYPLLTKCWE